MDIRKRQCTYTIKNMSDQKDSLEKDLYKKIPSEQKTKLKDFIVRAYRKSFDMTKTKQRDKFSKLQEKIVAFRTEEQKDDNDLIKKRWVVNVSSKELTLVAISPRE